MKKTKEKLLEVKLQKKEDAKLVKESNRQARENFMMLKEIIL